MTAREAAEELGVSERTVRRWITEGRLTAEKRGGAFVVDLDEARDVLLDSRAGRGAERASALGEMRGRCAELRDQLTRLEQELASERAHRLRFEAILYPPASLPGSRETTT